MGFSTVFPFTLLYTVCSTYSVVDIMIYDKIRFFRVIPQAETFYLAAIRLLNVDLGVAGRRGSQEAITLN